MEDHGMGGVTRGPESKGEWGVPRPQTQKVERVIGPAGERGSISRGTRSWKSATEG